MIADSRGGIYFTDPAPRPAPDVAPKEPGNVHNLSPKGEVLVLDGQIRRPNGLTLSIDEKTLYVGDTEGEFVYAFDVAADGRVSNKRQFARLIELERAPSVRGAARMAWQSTRWAGSMSRPPPGSRF